MLIDAEGEALKLLRDNGFDPADPPVIEVLAAAVIGAANVRLVPGLPTPALYRPATDTIELRPSLSPLARRWALGHELAERTIRRACWSDETVESYADALGAALLVPGPALRRAVRELGRSLPTLARVFRVSQTIVTLRLGEVTGSPLALVTPDRVRVRGEEWGWPSEPEIRRVARTGHPAIERVVLTDARRRVSLWAA